MQTLILIILWAISLVISYHSGFLRSRRENTPKKHPKPPEPTKEQILVAKKAQLEHENFIGYTGDEMQDPDRILFE